MITPADQPKRRSTRLLAATLLVGAVALGALAGHAGSWVVLLLIAAAAIGVVLTRSPYVGLLAVIVFLPLERIGALETAAGTIRASQVIALVTLGAWLLRLLLRRERRRPNPVLPALAVFLSVGVAGLAQAPNLRVAASILVVTAFTIGVGMLVPQLITTHKQLHRAVVVLLFGAALVSVFGLFQFLGDMIGLPTTITGLRDLYTKEVFGFPRVQSTAHEPLYFANYLLLPLGVVYALILSKRAPLPRWVLFGLFALMTVNLVLTVSRGGYLGFVATILVITLLALRDVLRLRVLLPMTLGILVVGLAVSQALQFDDAARLNLETFTTHIRDVFFGASYTERVETFEQARAAFWASPLVGIGPGSFGPFVAQTPITEPESGWKIVNNEPLEILVEYGIIGAFAVAVALAVLLLRSLRALRVAPRGTTRYVLLGLLGSCVGILVQYQTFSTLYIMHVWIGVGLLLAAQHLILQGEEEGT